MLKFVVDATPIRPKPSGVGIYVANLIKALYQLQEEENFQLGISRQPSIKNWLRGNFNFPKLIQDYSPLYTLPLPVTLTNILAKYPNPILPYLEKKLDCPDIVHGTDHFVYPCRQSRTIMTIHDLTFIKYPNYATSIVKSYTNRVKQCLNWTDLIITFSENTKKDIVKYLRVEPQQIFITPQASRYCSNTMSAELEMQLKRSLKYDFASPYLLFVSTLEPRKNIGNLVNAFNYLKFQHKIPHNLVLIGKKGWHYQSIFAAIEASPWSSCIHHLDYLSDELVALFYSQADVFVYPSYYEGFGLPVLEAMTLGTPVVTANTSSLPEVAGDAALLINPHEPIELAEAILNIISDTQLRHKLIQKGKQRAQMFSWQKTARETIKAYYLIS